MSEVIQHLLGQMPRAVKYVGYTEEPTPRWNDGFAGTHRHHIRTNTSNSMDATLNTLREHFALSWVRIVWNSDLSQFEARFLAESKDYRQQTEPKEVPEERTKTGQRSPYSLACILRAHLSKDVRLMGELQDDSKKPPTFQIVIVDDEGNAAQMWFHESSGFWQVEEGAECDVLAQRLGGTFVANATRDEKK